MDELTNANWRKSSYSGGGGVGGGNCVEVAALTDGRVAVRDSKAPAAGYALFNRAALLRAVTSADAR